MPIVQMPDGAHVRFPDEMPREQIRDMIAKKFPDAVPGSPHGAQLPDGFVLDTHTPSKNPQELPEGFTLDDPIKLAAGGDMRNQQLAVSRGAVNGLPIIGPYVASGVEHLAAGLRAPFTDKTYSEELAGIQDRAHYAETANPGLTKIGGAVGGVIGSAPFVAAAPALFGAGTATLPVRMGISGLTGSGLGAADATVRSGGDPDAIKEAALWGGGLGMASPVVGGLIGKGVGALASRYASPRGSVGQFARAAIDDGISAEEFGSRLKGLGADALPIDLGPNLQHQAGALAATPGRGQEVIRSAIANRTAASGSRIANSLDNALGQPVDTVALADGIIAKQSAAAEPLYKAAYAKQVPVTQELLDLFKRPAVAEAFTKASKLAANEGIAINPRAPSTEVLDLTKRSLDDMISSATRAGNANEARILTQTKNALVKHIDGAVPEYAAARKAFSGPAQVLDAIEEGKAVFSKKMTPNELRTQMLQMNDAQKEAFVQGGRSAVADIMGTARNDALAAKNLFANGYNKEKLEVLVGKDQAAKMLGVIDAEHVFTKTRDVVTGNSETAARAAAMKDVTVNTGDGGVLKEAANFNFGTAAASLMSKIVGSSRSAAQEARNLTLARMLTNTGRDTKSITQAIKALQSARQRGDVSSQQANQIVQIFRFGSGGEISRKSPPISNLAK
ncbi:hypothetical protein [Phyllobacterium meliloti]|uniref:hypothetical protein n=1 Tax=Phyllobacterium meliloti TaxID=555317 RepID=UPI001D1529E6|nr:hypothetical protein [Phyllobacterium sp. T1293]UGX86176.1 hypothetical protein LLE53_017390 [Phyllobacterium sp. T1293]